MMKDILFDLGKVLFGLILRLVEFIVIGLLAIGVGLAVGYYLGFILF